MGWQFDEKFLTSKDGLIMVVNFVPLIGGLDQNVVFPSFSILMGFRSPGGYEFQIGPNVSPTGGSFVYSVGYSHKYGKINIPVNLAFAYGKEGTSVTLLTGFNWESAFCKFFGVC